MPVLVCVVEVATGPVSVVVTPLLLPEFEVLLVLEPLRPVVVELLPIVVELLASLPSLLV